MSLKISNVRPELADIEKTIHTLLIAQNLDKKIVKNQPVFIKINNVYDRLMIGSSTAPYILEAVLRIVVQYSKKITVGDCDDIFHQVEKGFARCGTKAVCNKYHVKLVNLSREKFVTAKTSIPEFESIQTPEVVEQAKTFISLPVLKTHFESGITGALKNQFGLLPMHRTLYHHRIGQALAAVHSVIKNKIVIADGTIAMEGHGPIMGHPVDLGIIMVGDDYVACDWAFCKIIKLPLKYADHITICQQYKIGKPYSSQINNLPVKKFKRALRSGIQEFARTALKTNLRKKIFYYNPLVWAVEKSILHFRKNILWYNRVGKPVTKQFLKENRFGALWVPYLNKNSFSHPLDIALFPLTSPGKYQSLK